jgi:hypothetical protein
MRRLLSRIGDVIEAERPFASNHLFYQQTLSVLASTAADLINELNVDYRASWLQHFNDDGEAHVCLREIIE